MWDAARLVKDDHHAVLVVDPGVGIGVLLGPQFSLGAPVARALAQVTLDQCGQPGGGYELGGRRLPPVRVDGHRRPLGQLAPGHVSQLALAVGRNDHARSKSSRQHPQDEPTDQGRFPDPPPRGHGSTQRVEHGLWGTVTANVVRDRPKNLTLPPTRPTEVLQRRVLLPPRERKHDERLRIITHLWRPQLTHEHLLLVRGVAWLLRHQSSSSVGLCSM